MPTDNRTGQEDEMDKVAAIREMSDRALLAICNDFADPRRADANEEMDARQAGDWSRRTPAGGES